MATLQILRGSAALPHDLEDRFRRAFGREMKADERDFFGLAPQSENEVREPELLYKAA
jgi:hypothetical protein